MSPLDYRGRREWTLDEVRFRHAGAVYRGKGLLTYATDGGFHLEAFASSDSPPKDPIQLVAGIAPRQSYSPIRATSGGQRIVIPPEPLVNRFDLLQHGRLALDVRRVLFIDSILSGVSGGGWPARALLLADTAVRLPQSLNTRQFIADEPISMTGSLRGLHEVNDRMALVASLGDDGFLDLQTAVFGCGPQRGAAWRLVEGFQYALGMLSGNSVALIARQTEHNRWIYQEVQAAAPRVKLGFLNPMPWCGPVPAKDAMLQLALFLSTPSLEERMSKKVFRQLVAAKQQPTWYGTQIMTATILEAALRTLYEMPLGGPDPKWNVDHGLKQFQQQYLQDRSWKAVRKDVYKAWKKLRDSNAHPDWLCEASVGDELVAVEATMNDMQLLTWFYGKMILAVSGWQPIECDPPQ